MCLTEFMEMNIDHHSKAYHSFLGRHKEKKFCGKLVTSTETLRQLHYDKLRLGQGSINSTYVSPGI